MFAASKTDSVSGAAPDDKFNYVTMLLHGDGTNGAQNNTFLDSGPNTFTITRNGNTTQGSFSPYGSNWSGYFDSGANISSSTWNSAGVFGTSDFTVECWVYAVAAQNSNQVIFTNSAYPSTNGFYFRYTGSGSTDFTVNTGTSTLITASGGWSLNAWHHVAVTRASGTITLWIDGVSRGTSSFTNNCSDGMQYIGRPSDTGANYFMQGYLSNFRITKSAALYTSTFTPSTTPLTTTVSSGTVSLLCLQSNRFIDNSTNAYVLTANNSPSVQRFNPFGASTAYSTSVIGGSGYFDGSDSLSGPTNETAFQFGTGDFTVEAWVYHTADDGYPTILEIGNHLTTTGILFIKFGPSGGNVAAIYSGGFKGSTPVTMNAWNHIAYVRSSGSLKIYVNGVSPAGVAFTNDLTNSNKVTIGTDQNLTAGYYFAGNISNLRVVKGTAVYTADFTPPTAPLTAISGTSLLMPMINAGIFDNAMMTDLETVGNAQISTSVKKYGTGSIVFDGSGDSLNTASNPAFGFGTGDFTVEYWVYPSLTGDSAQVIVDSRPSDSASPWLIGHTTGGAIRYYDGSTVRTGGTMSANTWSHVAWSRSSNVNRIFLNGTQVSTYTATQDFGSSRGLTIGSNVLVSNEKFIGNIDDLRITKGYARYTTTFTAPTAAFSDTGPY